MSISSHVRRQSMGPHAVTGSLVDELMPSLPTYNQTLPLTKGGTAITCLRM